MSNGTPITTELLSLGISSHNNHYLFSDHFLNVMLKRERPWEAYWGEAQKQADAFLLALTELYRAEQPALPSYSESQLEDNWFKKIFALLGHSYEGQAKVSKLDESGVRYPDFAFFADETSRQTAAPHQTNSKLYFQHALAVGEVKKWDVPLGKKTKGGDGNFDNNNPSFQIDYYLRATELAWGVLSNGRLWRLIHKDTSYKLDIYFEIDLAKAIEEQNKAAVMFFLLFFGRASFQPSANNRCFLDEALQASRDYAQKLEADLRDNAYKALEHLIQGFMEPSANKLTADDLPAIYTNSLYLLYRIIFLLYGESRELLPLKNKHYQQYSLTVLAREIGKELDKGASFLSQSWQYWEKLKHLFTIMSGENEALNREMDVPRYNGGLFNPQVHPFLEQYVVGDKFLVAAIDVLARRDSADAQAITLRETVDYRDLGVRQIGSIYEGLLEYQPRRATEELVAVRKGKVEQWIPSAQKPKGGKPLATRRAGDIYLVTDKGERKATGSYYTPDYIVKYIVENTLGPLVEEARARVKATGKGVAHAQQLADEILQLRVLDPAMGSGHFLVEAADYLARAIATDEFVQVGESPALQDDDVVFWRRQVVERCIYGVDKNRMAVELAKLSLWLVTVARDKPLSFLDHHLRHGDSLVGARLADLGSLPVAVAKAAVAPAQERLFDEAALTRDLHLAVGGMQTIGRMLSDNIEDIHAKEAIFAQLRQEHMGKWRKVADLWVSHFFGNGMTQEAWPLLVDYIQQGERTGHDLRLLLPHLERVQENDYFHWELEFPEVFFDEYGRSLKGNGGFDVVVGNPPYVGFGLLPDNIRDYLSQNYNYFVMKGDLYILFLEISKLLVRKTGRSGLLVQNKWLYANYGRLALDDIKANTNIEEIIDFHDSPVFEISAYPLIIICSYGVEDSTSSQKFDIKEKNTENIIAKLFDKSRFVKSSSSKRKVELTFNNTIPLAKFAKQIGQGVLSGMSEAFIDNISSQIVEHKLEKPYLLPFVAGSDIQKYYIPPINKLPKMIYPYTKNGTVVPEENIPNILSFLNQFAEGLIERKNFGSRLIDQGKKWYELKHSANGMLAPKFLFPEISLFNRFYFDSTGDVSCIGSVYFLIRNEEYNLYSPFYLLALLNSKLLSYQLSTIAPTIRGGYFRYQSRYVGQLAVHNILFNTHENIRELSNQKALQEFKQEAFTKIIEWTETELAQNRNDTIHDLLAYLAEQMMEMNRLKQSHIEAFWLDMEGVAEEKILAAVRTKGKWEEAVYDKVASARPFVRSASRSTITLEQTLAWNEESFKGLAKMLVKTIPNFSQWVQTYRAHHAAVAPLAQRLQATDALIDQIVYRLYGLTAEEIALVEGGE